MKKQFEKRREISCFRQLSLLLIILLLLPFSACQKIDYTEMENPAYLRVFNSLNLPDVIETGVVDSLPYLCMLINPTYDGAGELTGAEIIGDFLDRRENYAPPFPQHIGVSVTTNNPEYPGKESVLVGPVLNGFDLSSWAQVPSGELEVLFMFRPRNEVPFFELAPIYRRSKAAHDKITLMAGEVYTLQILYEEFHKRRRTLLLRQEDFHKRSFSDSLVYVNFYNYSAENYYHADPSLKLPNGKLKENLFEGGVRDTMDVFLTLMQGQDFIHHQNGDGIILRNARYASSSINGKYIYTLHRDLESRTNAPYLSFPLWVNDEQNGISTDLWQRFFFISPAMGIDPSENPFEELGVLYGYYQGGIFADSKGQFATINCLLNGQRLYIDSDRYHAGVDLPNLIISTHSGQDNPRSFSTVSTFEIINGGVYLTTVQRKYAPPVH